MSRIKISIVFASTTAVTMTLSTCVLAIFIVTLILKVNGFFFSKKAQPEVAGVIFDPQNLALRGVSENMMALYGKEHFICDNGMKTLSTTAINDNFCDCADKSDEPGTNACLGGKFVCANNGYKEIVIPSSRVDDQVCDCCDGSDEGIYHQCPNICKQVADGERAALEKYFEAFRRGFNIRNDLIQTALKDREPKGRKAAYLESEKEKLNKILSAKKDQLDASSKLKEQNFNKAKSQVLELLHIPKLGSEYLVPFASNLLQVLGLSKEDLQELTGTKTEPVENSNVNDFHRKRDHDSYDEDGYGDADAYAAPDEGHHDEASSHSDGAISEEVTISGEASSPEALSPPVCSIEAVQSHPILHSFCDSLSLQADIENLVIALLQKYQILREVMLLVGFYEIYQSFDLPWLQQRMQEERGLKTFPKEFSDKLPNHCSTFQVKLEGYLQALAAASAHDQSSTLLESSIASDNDKLETLQSELNESNEAKAELELYKDFLEFLALKGQCFETVGGKFSYSVCLLDKVTQKEIDGHREVTLGRFDSLSDEELQDNYVVNMNFSNGEYCHAFGARKATVRMSCGVENKVISASEPSTCSYLLEVLTPAACSPKYERFLQKKYSVPGI